MPEQVQEFHIFQGKEKKENLTEATFEDLFKKHKSPQIG